MTHVEQGAGGGASGVATLVVVTAAELKPTYPVGELIGRRVINDDGEEIGRLDELMAAGDRLAFAVLSVGGFLGIGAHQVVVAFDALVPAEDSELMLPGATRAALKAMTAFDHSHLRRARPGVQDAGEVVSTYADEPIPGQIADIADGDPDRR